MLIVHISIRVTSDKIAAFKTATIENAKKSRSEPDVIRFDVIQQQDDPTRFVLVEIFKNPDGPMRHKETDHYTKWRDTVEDLMAEPRTSTRYDTVFPDQP